MRLLLLLRGAGGVLAARELGEEGREGLVAGLPELDGAVGAGEDVALAVARVAEEHAVVAERHGDRLVDGDHADLPGIAGLLEGELVPLVVQGVVVGRPGLGGDEDGAVVVVVAGDGDDRVSEGADAAPGELGEGAGVDALRDLGDADAHDLGAAALDEAEDAVRRREDLGVFGGEGHFVELVVALQRVDLALRALAEDVDAARLRADDRALRVEVLRGEGHGEGLEVRVRLRVGGRADEDEARLPVPRDEVDLGVAVGDHQVRDDLRAVGLESLGHGVDRESDLHPRVLRRLRCLQRHVGDGGGRDGPGVHEPEQFVLGHDDHDALLLRTDHFVLLSSAPVGDSEHGYSRRRGAGGRLATILTGCQNQAGRTILAEKKPVNRQKQYRLLILFILPRQTWYFC